ncbi:MAG: histidine kinase [Verrucomicrobia bacterium]|nr:histidine kinase [Verrucomicrobiota bacterium]
MSPPASSRLLPVLTFLALQAALWLVLALAFAALLVLVGSIAWQDAFAVSALNWLPWAVLAPGVFWLSLRCPLLPGHLLRSVPAHLVACVACIVLTLGIALQGGPNSWFGPRPGGDRPDFRKGPPPDGGFFRGPGSPGDGPRRRDFGLPPDDGPRAEGEAETGARPPLREWPRREPPGDFGRGGFGRGEPGGFSGGRGPKGPGPDGSFRSPPTRNADGTLTFPDGRKFDPSKDGRRGGGRGPGPGSMGGFFPPLGSLVLRFNFDLAVYLIVAAAAHALAFYRRAQERDRHALELAANLNRAKLDALRLQLQPHFLFNTLNAIATLVHRDAHAADNLIGDLSDLLRLSLLTTDHEVPLAREIELLDRYLAIEQTRLGERLRVQRDIDPGAISALVPTFVLQPLAENSIRHGLEPRSAPGTITISARRDGDRLHLTMADDGVGLSAGPQGSRRGIGLANTEARLQALHGTAAKLELHTPPEGGLRVEIMLPFRTAQKVETTNPH